MRNIFTARAGSSLLELCLLSIRKKGKASRDHFSSRLAFPSLLLSPRVYVLVAVLPEVGVG